MKTIRFFFVLFCAFSLFSASFMFEGCSNPPAQKEKVSDGGTLAPAIEITLDPKNGAKLEPKKACIKVTFSRPPNKRNGTWKAFLKEGTHNIPGTLIFEEDTIAKFCPFSLLRQGKKFEFELTVKEPVKRGKKAREFNVKANYSSKAPYKDDDPAKAGQTINLKLGEIVAPRGLTSIVENLSEDNIPPILVMVYKRDSGKSGNIQFLGGLGKGPSKGPVHKGKDVVDTKTPVSLLLDGKFNGRQYAVGPTTFNLNIAGVSIQLQEFHLDGVFSKDGKTVESGNLVGVIDPVVLKANLDLDICLMLKGECYKNKDGDLRIRLAAKLTGINNPLEFSIFITDPLYLQTGIDPSKPLTFYTNKETDKDSISLKLFECKGEQDKKKPCKVSEKTTVEEIKGAATAKLEGSKTKGTITAKLKAKTWYRLEMVAKSTKGKEFKTFVIFETK